jgi:hypothetical protein
MANERYPVLTATGGDVLPVADAVLYTGDMSASSASMCQVYFEFFSDAAGTVPVAPTAGVVSVEISPMGSGWMASSNHNVINASSAGVSATYEPPLFEGRASKGRVTLSGITGAVTARITFWRY